MKVFELGQDRKIAALRTSFYVHFLFWVMIMNEKYMYMALEQAKLAYYEGEIPIGVIIVKDDRVIARAYNKKEKSNCAIYHAEMLAIVEATKILNNWRLEDCDIYVTLEPCPMCASAIKQSRIKNVYAALSNSDKKNTEIVEKIFEADFVNPKVKFFNNIMEKEAKELLQKFFLERRKK